MLELKAASSQTQDGVATHGDAEPAAKAPGVVGIVHYDALANVYAGPWLAARSVGMQKLRATAVGRSRFFAPCQGVGASGL